MLPPDVTKLLDATGHDAASPALLGAHNLPDDTLVQLAASDGRVIVTENANDFAAVTTSVVLFVRKSWWPSASLTTPLTAAIGGWTAANLDPDPPTGFPPSCDEPIRQRTHATRHASVPGLTWSTNNVRGPK